MRALQERGGGGGEGGPDSACMCLRVLASTAERPTLVRNLVVVVVVVVVLVVVVKNMKMQVLHNTVDWKRDWST